jgi:hypothetical protein
VAPAFELDREVSPKGTAEWALLMLRTLNRSQEERQGLSAMQVSQRQNDAPFFLSAC